MGQPAAKQGDKITAIDIHIILVPAPPGPPVPVPLPHSFTGTINGQLSRDVMIMGRPAATQGSTAINMPPHVPPVPGNFQKPPSNKAKILMGSLSVMINGKPAARNGDSALTCNDPVDASAGKVLADGSVFIG